MAVEPTSMRQPALFWILDIFGLSHGCPGSSLITNRSVPPLAIS